MKQIIFGLLLLLILPSCNLSREDEGSGDIQSFVPPVEVANQVEGAIVRLEPVTLQFEVGANATVQIQVDNVTDLVGVDIELRFNPALLQVQDADPASEGTQIQPGDFLAANFVTINQADNNTGVIRYIVAQTDTAPVSGNGILALVTFLGVSPGSDELPFTLVKLANNQAQPIAVTPQSGQVTVNTPDSQPPAETPIASEPTATTESEAPEATATLPAPSPTDETQPPIPTTPPEDTQPPPVVTQPPPPEATTPPTVPTATPNIACTPVPKGPTPDPDMCPSPTPNPIPPGATLGFCYQVQYRDTIYSIAKKYTTSAEILNTVNDLWPRDMVYAHMALFIPTHLGYGPNFYMTKSGDTLQSISDVCHLTVGTIIKANPYTLNHNTNPEEVLATDTVLEIPIPPFPPPAKFKHPISPLPPVIPPPIAPFAAP